MDGTISTDSENSTPTNLKVEVSLIFSINTIMNIILSGLDTRTLKNCRYISLCWKDVGALELKKRISIKVNFTYASQAAVHVHNNGNQYMVTEVSPCPQLDLHQGSSASSLCNSSNALLHLLISVISSSSNFPCESFVIETETLTSPQMTQFIRVAGHLFKRLKLVMKRSFEICSVRSSSVFYDVLSLLLFKVQNLQILNLQVQIPQHWKQQIRNNDFKLTLPKPHSLDMSCLQNLKQLTMHSNLPHQFFCEIMNRAVRLQEYYGSNFGTYFIDHNKGVNRIHLLKQLEFELDTGSNMEIVAELLRQHKNTLTINCLRVTISKNFYHDRITLLQREVAVAVLNNLFEISRKTLKKLTVESLRGLWGLSIPEMPKLRSVLFLKNPMDFVDSSFEKHFFYDGFVASKCFPVLTSITFICHTHTFMNSFDLDVRYLVNISLPLPSVKYVRLTMENNISEATMKLMSKTLPHASIVVGYEEDGIE